MNWLPNNSNGEEVEAENTDESQEIGQNYKQQYVQLKKKLKILLFENEFFQENLKQNQKRLLKVSRDKSFLLDRLLKYEPTEVSSSDETSSEEDPQAAGGVRKRKYEMSGGPRQKKIMVKKQPEALNSSQSQIGKEHDNFSAIERHLEARNSISSSMMPSYAFPQEIFDEVDI